MKIWMLIPMIGVVAWGILLNMPSASGQQAGRAVRSPLNIAVVDIGQILQRYKKAERLLEGVKAVEETKNSKLKEMFGKGQELAKSLKDGSIAPETAEFRDAETKVFQLESYVKTYKASAEKEIQREGAQAIVAAYHDIQEALKVFAENSGLTLILRIDSDAANSTNPQMIGRTLGQDVIYRQCRDITAPVTAYLNRQYESSTRDQSAAGGQSPSAPSRPATGSTPSRKPNSR